MRRLGSSARHYVNYTPDNATYEQCQKVWNLMLVCKLEPIWIEKLPYGQAIALISNLEQLRHRLLTNAKG